MRVLVFPASRRRDSYNGRLADHLAELLVAAGAEVDLLAPDQVDLPLFDQDLEADSEVMGRVRTIRDRFAGASGLVVATPEYNHDMPPYLKNTVDWVSRLPHVTRDFSLNPFRHKPVLLASASTGWTGGSIGLKSVRSLFAYMGGIVMPDEIALSDVESLLVDGRLRFSEGFDAYVRRTIDHFAQAVRHVS